MSPQVIAAMATGITFLVALLVIGCYIAFRGNQAPIPSEAMFIFRVVLALAAAGFAAVLPGFLDIDGKVLSISIKAAGSLAVFLLIYRINPPEQFGKTLPKPKTRVVDVPADRIEQGREIK